MNQRGWFLRWMLKYTLLFALCFAVCYSGMLLSGHMPIWQVDGLMQHYPYFAYIGQWLRDAAGAIFSGGAVKMFDFSLGFGEDVLTSMNYYGLGDPLTLISAFFAGSGTEAGFFLLVVLRVWCAGLACGALAKYKGFDEKQSLYSALTYAFGLWLFAEGAIRQTMFLNPCIHFPLMVLGLERVFDQKKPWVLSLAVLLAALCGFYFLYTSSVLLLVYALVRQFTRGAEKPLRTLPITAARAVGWYLLGLGLSAVVFLPVAAGFLNGQRLSSVGVLSELRLHYSLRDYLRLPLALISARGMGAAPFMPVLSALGIGLMLARHRREDRSWLWLMAVTLALILIPATGWVLNGFSYETTRWSYAPALLAAMAGGKMLPELLHANERDRRALGILSALMLVYLAAMTLSDLGGSRRDLAVAMAAVALTLAFLLPASRIASPSGRRACCAALAVLVLMNVGAAYSRMWSGRESGMMRSGESFAMTRSTPWANLDAPSEFSRTDADISATDSMINGAALANTPSTAIYNSIISGVCHRMMRDVANAGLVQINAIVGLDGRAALEAIWSAGRFVSADETTRVPYGFDRAGESGGYAVYENANALPIGYAMTQTMSREDYDALSPLDKQWALLQRAVLDEPSSAVPAAAPATDSREIPIESVQMDGIVSEDGLLRVDEGGAIRLTFDAPAGCELYLELEGLAFQDGQIDLGNRVDFSCAGQTNSICLMPSGFELDLLDRECYLVNLGYDAQGRTSAEVRFARPGVYRLRGLKLRVQPMETFDDFVAHLRQNGLKDVRAADNAVTGTIDLAQPAVLVFSIPYSDGWTAQIDGQAVETLASAGTLLAVEADAGSHEVSLRYRTPWLYEGCAISGAAILIFAAIALIRRKKSRVI